MFTRVVAGKWTKVTVKELVAAASGEASALPWKLMSGLHMTRFMLLRWPHTGLPLLIRRRSPAATDPPPPPGGGPLRRPWESPAESQVWTGDVSLSINMRL